MARSTRFSRWALALVVALAALGMTFGVAAAAPSRGTDKPARRYPRVEAAYKVQQQRLKLQGDRLDLAGTHADKVDALIAQLKAKGQDTSALEQALAAFRAAIERARAEWQAASDVLASHAGFGDDGKVTDAEQARATLDSAHGHMQQVHQIIHAANQALRAALVDYRKSHRAPVAPPTPVEP